MYAGNMPESRLGRELRLFFIAFIPFKNIEPIEEHTDNPEKSALNDLLSWFGLVLIPIGFIVAYGLYADRQTLTLGELVVSLLPADTRPNALLNSLLRATFYNVAFLSVTFVGFGFVLGVSAHWIIGTVRLVVYTIAGVTFYFSAATYLMFYSSSGWLKLLGAVFGVLFCLDFLAVGIILYILIKRRMGAGGFQQPLLPLIEAALGARALSIALQGNATLVNIPAPHWVVAYGPALLVMLIFGARAVWLQRQHIEIEQREAWEQASRWEQLTTRADFNARLRRIHWLRFVGCLALMVAGVIGFALYK